MSSGFRSVFRQGPDEEVIEFRRTSVSSESIKMGDNHGEKIFA